MMDNQATIEEKREVHIGVMVKPSIAEKLEKAKGKRRGKTAAKSAVVNDILEYFFAMGDAEVQKILHKCAEINS